MSRGYVKTRRVKRSTAARIRPFWILIAFFGALALLGLVYLAMWPGFNLKRVTVSGNQRVSTDEILARAEIPTNRSIWFENTRAIADRIRAIPYVDSVSVGRIPPASLTVWVTERVPFAILQSGATQAIVDHAMRVLSPASGDERLPVFILPNLDLTPGRFVTAPDALALRESYTTLAGNGVFPASLAFDRFGGLVATTPSGLRILFGERNDLGHKVRLLQAILAQVVRRQRSVAAIDLRAPGTPVVVYR
ncbi:MAG: FtsQ-type POTRA domain-containing protein [Candidatus Cybelea sp.]